MSWHRIVRLDGHTSIARSFRPAEWRALLAREGLNQASVKRWFPFALLAAYLILFVVAGIAPHERAVWWAENIPIVALAGTLVVLYARGVRLSNLGYAFASVLLFMHTVGTVVGSQSKLGDRCVLLGNNTIGSGENGGAPRIGAGTILGAGVRVLGDIEIGENCAVGANAVVVKDIPAGKIAVGIPARVIKDNRPPAA